ncbi:MAG: hypothetical protein LBN00_09925 [Oscillospiraceae bacterium]|jgi:flagellar biosynthesis component FlhA|nr:hypothetical protein [Oscillospiraceae bacterium]
MDTPLTLEEARRAVIEDAPNTDKQRALALISGEVVAAVSADFLRDEVKAATLETLNTHLFPQIKALRERAKAEFGIDMPQVNFRDAADLAPRTAIVAVGGIKIWGLTFRDDAEGIFEKISQEIFGVLENIFTIDRFQIHFGTGGDDDRVTFPFARDKLLVAVNEMWQWLFAERGIPAQKTRIRNSNDLAPQEFLLLIDGVEVWRRQFTAADLTERADASADEITDALERKI